MQSEVKQHTEQCHDAENGRPHRRARTHASSMQFAGQWLVGPISRAAHASARRGRAQEKHRRYKAKHGPSASSLGRRQDGAPRGAERETERDRLSVHTTTTATRRRRDGRPLRPAAASSARRTAWIQRAAFTRRRRICTTSWSTPPPSAAPFGRRRRRRHPSAAGCRCTFLLGDHARPACATSAASAWTCSRRRCADQPGWSSAAFCRFSRPPSSTPR